MIVTSFAPAIQSPYTNKRFIPAMKMPRVSSALKIGMSSDSFTKEPSFNAKPFTIEWYKSLSPEQIAHNNKVFDEFIYHNIRINTEFFNKLLQYNDIIATGIKNTLNKKFGAGNYIVIPIGRSLFSVGKCLGYKIGEENVKSLPMSSAGRFLDLENCNEDFNILIQYLNSIGLSKEEVKKSDKHYIFMDYCNSGRGLRGVKNLFESDKMWGHLDNVHFDNVFNLIPKISTKQIKDEIDYGKTFNTDLKGMLQRANFKKYSLVKDCPRFYFLKEAVPDPKDYTFEQQAFYWILLKKEMEQQFKTETKANASVDNYNKFVQELDSLKKSGILKISDDCERELNNILLHKEGKISENYKNGLLALLKLKYFTKDEYKKLTKNEINCINEAANNYIYENIDRQWFDETLLYNDIVATGMKDKLNHMFGEGNYTVIPVGRSLSSIGKCLGYKIGEDNVKMLPMTKAWRFNFLDSGMPLMHFSSDEIIDSEQFKDEDFDALRKYLESIGLSKQEIEKSEKQYVFTDYCFSGDSFYGIKSLFKSDKIYGNLSNVRFFNILHLLKTVTLKDSTDIFCPGKHSLIENIEKMMTFPRFKEYSFVRQCTDLSKTKDKVIKPEDYGFERRIFYFKLLENQMEQQGFVI